MTKLIAILAGGLLLGIGAASVQLLGSSSPAGAAGTSTDSTESVTTGFTGEATTAETSPTPAPVATTSAAVDIPGPCDEAEHATDPRCTGAVPAAAERIETDDRGGHRGRGGDDRHGDDHDDDDRSGSNSGRG